jgi:hypothetical protein
MQGNVINMHFKNIFMRVLAIIVHMAEKENVSGYG